MFHVSPYARIKFDQSQITFTCQWKKVREVTPLFLLLGGGHIQYVLPCLMILEIRIIFLFIANYNHLGVFPSLWQSPSCHPDDLSMFWLGDPTNTKLHFPLSTTKIRPGRHKHSISNRKDDTLEDISSFSKDGDGICYIYIYIPGSSRNVYKMSAFW